jgi:hypothetical protein
MRQIAPDLVLLSHLVEQIGYKEGWDFKLLHLDRGQGSEGLTLIICVTCQDSYNPRHTMMVKHYMIVPAAAFDERTWTRWLLEQILLVEQHEACEFFQIDGHRPYAPNHGPGRDPYTIMDQGTAADAQTTFRGEHFDLTPTKVITADQYEEALAKVRRYTGIPEH